MNPDNNTPVTMTLTLAEWNLIITGLGELPLKHSAELWMKVRQMAAEQLAPKVQENDTGTSGSEKPQE